MNFKKYYARRLNQKINIMSHLIFIGMNNSFATTVESGITNLVVKSKLLVGEPSFYSFK